MVEKWGHMTKVDSINDSVNVVCVCVYVCVYFKQANGCGTIDKSVKKDT